MEGLHIGGTRKTGQIAYYDSDCSPGLSYYSTIMMMGSLLSNRTIQMITVMDTSNRLLSRSSVQFIHVSEKEKKKTLCVSL